MCDVYLFVPDWDWEASSPLQTEVLVGLVALMQWSDAPVHCTLWHASWEFIRLKWINGKDPTWFIFWQSVWWINLPPSLIYGWVGVFVSTYMMRYYGHGSSWSSVQSYWCKVIHTRVYVMGLLGYYNYCSILSTTMARFFFCQTTMASKLNTTCSVSKHVMFMTSKLVHLNQFTCPYNVIYLKIL
jgi:hypothetical protein